MLHILSVCVVALGIQHAIRMCHIVICALSDCAIFFKHFYLMNGTIFEKKKCTERKISV